MKHTFAICAYKESPYLESCVSSLINQSEPSDIIICTSTPNELIYSISKKYGLDVYIRNGESSLKDDWNFAVDTAVYARKAELVTVAHQDDVYRRDYVRELMRAEEKYPDMILFTSGSCTIDKDGREISWLSERIKRVLRLLLRLKGLADRSFIKRSALMFGNAICCPSCTYNIRLTGQPLFRDDADFVIDWLTLLRLSSLPGRFICIEKELMCYRVHPASATEKNIKNNNRIKEEYGVFLRIWPKPFAALIMKLYGFSSKAYG